MAEMRGDKEAKSEKKGGKEGKPNKSEKVESVTASTEFRTFEFKDSARYSVRTISMKIDNEVVASASVIVGIKKLVNFKTHPDHRRKGYGKILLDHIVKEHGVDYLIARPENAAIELPALIKFYASAGFAVTHQTKDWASLKLIKSK
jgi:ribosomal protein S18 acetylase RimI-like enzyme